jgi:Na+/proline symporter
VHWIDWTIVAVYLAWIVWDGLRLSKNTNEVEGYLLAGRSLPWWAVGLSVMATQLSAITLVGTTGQGYADGLRFVQFYFGLPIAMVVLSLTVVPFFYRARVYTAYEYLEKRFDVKTRTLAALLFLVQRGLGCGVIISAPGLILSVVLGWNPTLTILAIGLPTIVYTMFGGVQAVTWTDVKQMVLIIVGLVVAVLVLIGKLSHDVTPGQALHIAGAVGRLRAVDFKFDFTETYTFWSGLIGGAFLAMSYFGCDQSQVQRYLTAKSVNQGRHSLIVSAFAKIPLQVLVLATGVFVFAFFLFHRGPMLFNAAYAREVAASPRAAEYNALEREYDAAFEARRQAALAAADSTGLTPARAAFVQADAAVREVRTRAANLVKDVSGHSEYTDVNYVFPTFIVDFMPVGLVGLMIAAIFAAAMSSIAAELNALATASVIDIYRRHIKPDATDREYLLVSKLSTGVWGIFACIVAVYAANMGSLIEVVNKLGSYFFGSILGVFMLALGARRANGDGAFVGLIAGMIAVGLVARYSTITYLWYNVVGAVVVVSVGLAVSAATGGARRIEATGR